jgi:hypothetical protein
MRLRKGHITISENILFEETEDSKKNILMVNNEQSCKCNWKAAVMPCQLLQQIMVIVYVERPLI